MSTSIFVTVRTRNEEHRIGDFCAAYSDADLILIADGGSEDKTLEIARTFPNVLIKHYPVLIDMQNGYKRNPDGEHANFLFEWAYSLHPDWVIYDDCDCRPNFLLKQNYRSILEETDQDVVMAVRLYLWGKNMHFPNLAKPGESHTKWEASLYAWRRSMDLWTIPVPPAYVFRTGQREIKDFRSDTKALELFPPYCLLHCSWDDPDRTNQKVKTYRESGLIPGMLHPLEFGGELEPLPDWAHE